MVLPELSLRNLLWAEGLMSSQKSCNKENRRHEHVMQSGISSSPHIVEHLASRHQWYLARGLSTPPHGTGTVLNVLPKSECGQFIIKGYVEQHKAAGANSTTS